jgi:hypothetical protein
MIHAFQVQDAVRYGLNAAVILNNFKYWIAKNKADGRNHHDGRFWTYSTVKALAESFPYLTQKQVRVAIDKLIESGVLLKGNFNKVGYDRTVWYALTDETELMIHNPEPIAPKGQIDLPKRANGNASEGKPIPDSKPDNKTDNGQFDEFWKNYPRKEKKKMAQILFNKLSQENKIKAINDCKIRYVNKERQYIPHPTTYLNGEAWNDEIISYNGSNNSAPIMPPAHKRPWI